MARIQNFSEGKLERMSLHDPIDAVDTRWMAESYFKLTLWDGQLAKCQEK